MKIPLIFLVLLCVNIKCFECSFSFLDKIKNFVSHTFMNTVDETCQLTIELETPLDISNLRIIEYTIFGPRYHNLFGGFDQASETVVNSPHFDRSRKTVIFAHGFHNDPSQAATTTIVNAFKKVGGYNILALDSSSAMNLDYWRTSSTVKEIGKVLGIFIYQLTQMGGVNPDKIHLIGHSLGAHISGFAGKGYQSLTYGQKLPRITGLDPANPCFHDTTSNNRLDETDARFVDVIHTNLGVFGLNVSIGHADFFPNGGSSQQPGCDEVNSHSRAWMYFAESVLNPHSFIGTECNSWDDFVDHRCIHNDRVVMGLNVPVTANGDFYLVTQNSPKYGLGNWGV